MSNELIWGCYHNIGGRPYQEDTYIADVSIGDIYNLFGVFDGHGGSDISEFLSENAPDFISKSILEYEGLIEPALKDAFINLDKNIPSKDDIDTNGSTSIVVLINEDKIVCANCGDSRAVLLRNNECLKLSEDHKPERMDERTRIENSGGCVLWNTGIARVVGILSLTRAIGDKSLRKFGIIPDPDVVVLDRSSLDEFIIIASDGLWETVSSEEATQLAKRCIERAVSKGSSIKAASRIAANVLAKVSSCRGSTDNITVIIIVLNDM